MNRQRLSKILKALTPNETKADFKAFDDQVNQLKTGLTEKIQAKTLEDVNVQLEKFRRRIDLEPLINSLKEIENSVTEKNIELSTDLEERITELQSLIFNKASKEAISEVQNQIDDLESQLSSLEVTRKSDIAKLKKSIPDLTDLQNEVEDLTTQLSARVDALEGEEPQEIKDWTDTINTLRRELIEKINHIGGGSMNRQITVGNVDPLTKYTDINLKAGSNVTITTAVNNTTKRVDVTFASSGGGGGSTRSINSISISTAAGSASGTDYVYLCSGTLTLTLPDATTNTNLYTIKNVGTGIVTINTTSAQTIDGSLTIIMPVQYTAVDLISDTANWNVT